MNIQAVPGITPGLAPAPTGSTAPAGATLDSNSAEQTFIKFAGNRTAIPGSDLPHGPDDDGGSDVSP